LKNDRDRGRRSRLMGLIVVACVAACGLARVAAAAAPVGARDGRPVIAQPLLTYEQKMAWILMLEDRRILKDAVPFPAPAVPAPPVGKKAKTAPIQIPPPSPDLARLLTDAEARIRRRAALAIGRVGLADGVTLLAPVLAKDPEPEVRQMAGFAMGLIGNRAAVPALRAAFGDSSPLVQGRAAEALGLIGDPSAAPAIATMVAGCAKLPAFVALAPDDLTYPQPPEIEACRLGIVALTRLKAWDALAPVVLTNDGTAVSRWWPVAFALGRMEDPRARPALLAFAHADDGPIARAFAVRGLGTQKVAEAEPLLLGLVAGWKADPRSAVQAIRALGQLGTANAAPALRTLALTKDLDPNLRLETLTALTALRDTKSYSLMLDSLTDAWPAIRAAALRGAQAIEPDSFVAVLSGLDPETHVSVRTALVSILTKVDPESAISRLRLMAADKDARVAAAAISALAELKAPDLGPMLLGFLGHDDVMVRAAAAGAIGDLTIAGGAEALTKAYRAGVRDTWYNARAASLTALKAYGAGTALPVLREALQDKDWAIRVRAAQLMRDLDPNADVASAMRPGPARPEADYTRPSLISPPVSPHVFFDTIKGTIEIELYVLDAPQTCENFLRLARQGYFTGVAIHRVVPNFVVQDGDPRGDGEGSPGYTIRDEINEQPYLRGTVGMALEWADTGGSQWFVTHSPQPHLDGRYTVFGRVVAGLDVVDRIQQWDVIKAVRTWDGVAMTAK
jgi:cyclophilin family peptidyl-prolyl cis-trans isomerase/HEAT repeat protein